MSSFVRGPIAVTGIIWRCYFRLRSCFFSAKIRIRGARAAPPPDLHMRAGEVGEIRPSAWSLKSGRWRRRLGMFAGDSTGWQSG